MHICIPSNIHVHVLAAPKYNQPMDISVNKPAKDIFEMKI